MMRRGRWRMEGESVHEGKANTVPRGMGKQFVRERGREKVHQGDGETVSQEGESDERVK